MPVARITYTARETFGSEEPVVFEPAGSTYQDSVFLFNLFGSVGFLKGYDRTPYELHFKKPSFLYGSSSLNIKQIADNIQVFAAKDYFTVHDNPVLFAQADTAFAQVANARIGVSVYSPNGIIKAEKCLDLLMPIFDAASRYLGDTLPTDRYNVLLYCAPLDQMGSGFGALEHFTSTVVYLPEFESEDFYTGLKDVTAHEFMHIITPLSLHSEQIHYFDFLNPKMSKHLWLYEGITEYQSQLIQARAGLIEIDEFLQRIRQKIESAENYNPMIPMTTASIHALDIFKDEYLNVYQKGALVGLCLDLEIRRKSNFEKGLVDLLSDMGRIYGKDTFFLDESLFREMAQVSGYPSLERFFALYVESAMPLPLEELLAEVGIEYAEQKFINRLSLGGMSFSYNPSTERIFVDDVSDVDAFGKALKIKEGDEILTIKGMPFDLPNIESTLGRFFDQTQAGDVVEYEVMRPNKKGKYKKLTLKGKAVNTPMIVSNHVGFSSDMTEEQVENRIKWAGQ